MGERVNRVEVSRQDVVGCAREFNDVAAEFLAERASRLYRVDRESWATGPDYDCVFHYELVVELADVEVLLEWDPYDGWDAPSEVADVLAKCALEYTAALDRARAEERARVEDEASYWARLAGERKAALTVAREAVNIGLARLCNLRDEVFADSGPEESNRVQSAINVIREAFHTTQGTDTEEDDHG